MINIKITDLSAKTIIGTKKEERESPQEVIIDVSFNYDANKAIKDDNIKNAVDYETLANEIVERAETTEFFLLEKLADDILKIILKNKEINEATVRIRKIRLIDRKGSVYVEIKGSNKE